MNMHAPIKAVVFDVFGTMAYIGQKRRPYVQLLQQINEHRLGSAPVDGALVMSHDVDLAGTAALFGYTPDTTLLTRLEQELQQELATISLYPETAETLRALRAQGYRIGLCSNLAAGYGPRVQELLPFTLDSYSWSYAVGAVKPQATIYEHVCVQLQLTPQHILFVGDTRAADYTGPIAYGMHALHLVRDGAAVSPEQITLLSDVLQHLNQA